MSSNGTQVVFLIHPKFLNVKDNLIWQDVVFESVTKLLVYLESFSSSDKSCSTQAVPINTKTCELKWGYKCAKNSEIKFNCLHQFLGVTFKKLQDFKEEIEFNDEESDVDYSAHTLATNLVAIVHDFNWERLEILSPVKLPKINHSYTSKSCSKTVKSHQFYNLNDNFVFVVGPLPKSQYQLNHYFEWQIDSLNDITKILMPKHLALHFEQKHNIRFFWLDTQVIFDQPESDDTDHNGYNLINDFLKAHQGSVIPISVILNKPQKQELLENNKLVDAFSSSFQSLSTLSELNCTIGSDAVFVDNVKSYFNLSQHLPTSSILDHFCLTKNYEVTNENILTETLNLFFNSVCSSYLHTIKIEIQEMSSVKVSSVEQFLKYNDCLNMKKLNSVNSTHTKSHVRLFGDETVCNEFTIVSKTISDNIFNENNLLKSSLPSSMHVIGTISLTMLSFTALAGSTYLCKPLDCLSEYKMLMTYLNENNLVLLIERKFIVKENHIPLTFKDSSIFNQFGILQPISETCGSIVILSEAHKNEILGLLSESFTDIISNGDEIFQFIENSSIDFENKILHEIPSLMDSITSLFTTDDAKVFKPSMLESWYCLPATSDKLIEAFREEDQNSNTLDDEDLEFRDQIVSELQQLYSSVAVNFALEEAPSSKDTSSPLKYSEFSDKDLFAFVRRESEKCLKVELGQLQVIKNCAFNIVSATCAFVAKTVNDMEDCSPTIKDKVKELAFATADQIRGRDISPSQKCTECAFQIILRFEWHLREESLYTDGNVEDIVQLLRIISLSSNVDRMKEFLRESVVEIYSGSLGELLVEIHNHLMIPLPDVLRQFSSDTEHDESYFMHSVKSDRPPSSGPFALLSSVGSMDSSESLSCDRIVRHRKGSNQIKPVTARQIEVPKRSVKTQYDTRRKSVPPETVKCLFPPGNDQKRNSSKKKERNSRFSSPHRLVATSRFPDEVNKVRRDLFTSPSKRRKKTKNRQTSPEKRKSLNLMKRHHSVVDTPAAKQRLTALARQKLRLRRSFTGKGPEKLVETIVEESPLKSVENRESCASSCVSKPKVRRSPRHSIMLTRRHSFYRDGSYEKCRTVARAKVVQQHKEAVPPTPQLTQTFLTSKIRSKEKSFFSPKSLLFSYTGSSRDSKNSQEQSRPRRRLRLNSESQPVGSTPALTSSSPSKTVQVASSSQKHCLKSEGDVDARVDDDQGVDVDALHIEEALSPPFQSYLADPLPISPVKASVTLPSDSTCALPPLKRMQSVTHDSNHPINPKERLMSPPKLILANRVGVRRSPRLASKVALSPTASQVGPLDQYVVRTPTPNKQARPSRPHSITGSRRPSPIGDHIRKWPRKKRLSNSSPKTLERRQKLEMDEKAESHDCRAAIKETLNLSCSGVSPGVDLENFLERISPRKQRSNASLNSKKEIIKDMELFPIDDSTKTFQRWTSPRSKRSGTLYRAPVATKESFVSMVLLHDEPD